jgi:predicted nucleic acid-binding protein
VNVYIDTSAFYAIVDATDAHHRSAVQTWQDLLREGDALVTSLYVVTEAVALLHHRFGTEVVSRFLQDDLAVVSVHWIDQATHSAALGAMLAISGRSGPSLTDCASFEIIRGSRIDRVFAYDRHFQDRGFGLLGE